MDMANRGRAARSRAHLEPACRRCVMSVEKPDNLEPAPPRETGVLYGHGEAEQALLGAYRSSRFPHAWLIAGPAGIGKATLAYRMARFMLALPDPRAPQVQSAKSLHVDSDHPVARRIAIVDAVDDLNPSGANALLKILEEPPRRAVLLLVSRSAARVLPTMRSRCRSLVLRPLEPDNVARAAAAAIGGHADASEIVAASAAADGSVGRALALLDRDALDLRNRTLRLLEVLPGVDPRALHALRSEER